MTPDYLKQWQEMSGEEKVSWIATEVMGWTQWPWLHDHDEEWKVWNPLTNWNHWRQVEEKVMENIEIASKFYSFFVKGRDKYDKLDAIGSYVFHGLHTRCQALFLAYKSL